MSGGHELDWVRDSVFYEIFPDRFRNADPAIDPPGTVPWESAPTRTNFFGGDLAGILEKLPYLADLGVTGLYLTPIFHAGTNHRYDAHDYLEVDPVLGDEAHLREVVGEAHRRGIRVVLDGVFNHVGDGFWAFQDLVVRGEDSPYRNWFYPRGFPIQTDPPNYQTCGGAPYLPKLNTTDPSVREYLLRVATHWIVAANIDGWRLDVPWKVPREFWKAFRRVVKSAKPSAYLVGEMWHSSDGWLEVFDGQMNYELRRLLLDFCVLDQMDAEDLAIESEALLRRTPDPTLMLNLLGSHDTPRLMTVAEGDEARVLLAFTALFTYPGVPMIYYGDEVGLEGGDDPDCRRTMPWDPGLWRTPIAETVRRLIRLRQDHPALRRGTWEAVCAFNRVFAYLRRFEGDEVLVVLNAGAEQRDFSIAMLDVSPEAWVASDGTELDQVNGTVVIRRVPARASVLLLRELKGRDARQRRRT